MALNFPYPATQDQIYLAPNGVTYVYDGHKWVVQPTSPTGNLILSNNVITSNNLGNIYIDSNNFTWTFDNTGGLVFPDNTVQTTAGGGGNINTGNIRFRGDAIYDFNGIIVENADLLHGATAALILPANGDTSDIFLNRLYGGVTIGTGPANAITNQWEFGSDGTLNLPAASNGNAVIQSLSPIELNSQNNIWIFKTDGNLELPIIFGQDTSIGTTFNTNPPGHTLTLKYNGGVNDGSGGELQFNYGTAEINVVKDAGITRTWTFGSDGVLTLPDGGYLDDNGGITRLGAAGNMGVQIGSSDQQNYVTASDIGVTIQTLADTVNSLWVFDINGAITMPLHTRLNSGGIGNTNSAEFGTVVNTYTDNGIVQNSQIYMSAGTGEARILVNMEGQTLVYYGTEEVYNPNFTGMVSMDPNVRSQYAMSADDNGNILIGGAQIGGTLVSSDYIAGIGSLNSDYNMNGLYADTKSTLVSGLGNVRVQSGGGLIWQFNSDGTLTLPNSYNSLYQTDNALIKSIANIQISAGESSLIFATDGNLTVPNILNVGVTTYIGSNSIGNVPAAALNLNNSGAPGQLLTQLTLINTAGNGGTGSAIDFYTYTNQGNGIPGARLQSIDDDNYSGIFSIALKGPGSGGNNDLTTFWTFGPDGSLTFPDGSKQTSAYQVPDIVITGSWAYEFMFDITNTWSSNYSQPVIKVDRLVYNENGHGNTLTSFTFNNVVYIQNDFDFENDTILTSISMPKLIYVGGNFNISYDDALTNLDISLLTTVDGNFYPNNNNALTVISVPALTTVGGNFYPNYNHALESMNLTFLSSVGGDFDPNNNTLLTEINVPVLTAVGGGFYPNYNPAMISMDLTSLSSVGGDFDPNSNNSLTTISVPALTTVGGSFYPNYNPAMVSMDLTSLSSVGGDFDPNNNTSLTTISVPALTTVGGEFYPNYNPAMVSMDLILLSSVGGDFDPNNNTSLTTISVPELTTVSGAFYPNSNNSLTEISVPALTTIGGVFSPNYNSVLVSMDLSQLASVGGGFGPNHNPLLTAISAPALTSVGGGDFNPYNNDSLTEISVPVLATIGGGLGIQFNYSLTEISMPALTTIGGRFYPNNNLLTAISTPVLTTIGGDFVPNENTDLLSMDLTLLSSVGGNFRPFNNDSLPAINVPALTAIHGDFYPNYNPALVSMDLTLLSSVGGGFYPNTNTSLTAISVPALTTVGHDFNPNANPALISMDLTSLVSVGGSFYPYNNNSLTAISVPALTTIGGDFYPYGNNSLTEISAPVLTTIGGSFHPNTNSSLVTVNIPAIESISGVIVDNATTQPWATFNIGNSLKHLGGDVALTGMAFDQTSVDNLLVALAALDGTNGTTLYENHTVIITGTSSAPSATGLAAIATLQARGCTVTTN